MPVAPVACFVCLSGFLIPTSFQHSKSLGHFVRKRFLRTVPAIIPMLAFVWLALGFPSARDTLLNYFTCGYIGAHNVGTLWSLGVEDLLYACMVILFCAGVYKRPWAMWMIFLAVDVSALLFTRDLDRYRFWTTSCAFLGGGMLWVYRDGLDRIPLWLPASVLPICFGLIHLWAPLNMIGLPLTCVSAVLVAMKSKPIFEKMPDLSYGLYIWHFPLFFWLAPMTGRDLPHLLGIGLLGLLIAAVSWYLVEKPALKLKNREFKLFARTPETAFETT